MGRHELVIRIELPRWTRARWVLVAGLVSLVGGAVAWAGLYTPQTYAAGDRLSADRFNEELRHLKDAIDALDARTAGTADCPTGYTDLKVPGYVICKNPTGDEMVKVGTGLSAFWIDRYEASVWSNADGTGIQYGIAAAGVENDDYPATFPDNGQRVPSFTPLYAVSKAGVNPSANLTWFQAQEACRAGGKRLPTRHEWLAAASGTNDPGPNNGTGGACVTQGAGPRPTGGINNVNTCVSAWGAQDMIGNVWEWTDEWYAAPSWPDQPNYQSHVAWNGADYNGDALAGIASSAYDGVDYRSGVPSAAIRGGNWAEAGLTGLFALGLGNAPSHSDNSYGFRCSSR